MSGKYDFLFEAVDTISKMSDEEFAAATERLDQEFEDRLIQNDQDRLSVDQWFVYTGRANATANELRLHYEDTSNSGFITGVVSSIFGGTWTFLR